MMKIFDPKYFEELASLDDSIDVARSVLYAVRETYPVDSPEETDAFFAVVKAEDRRREYLESHCPFEERNAS